MSKEKKLLPELRFPEFEKDKNWEIETLGKLTKVISKRNKENKNLPVYSINNKEGFLPQGEQFEGMSSTKRNYDISLYKVIERNTFAYNPARINIGSIGYSGTLHNVIISSLYVCFKTKEMINDEFLLHFFDTSHFYNEVENNVEGGIRSYLFYQNFSNITIPIPKNPEEQQKIASCLSSLDELIAAHSKKLDALKDHKKGLMQNLFPQEGETVPKVRFAKFQGDGEWVEDELNNLCFNISSGKDKNQDNGVFDLYGSTGIIGKTEDASFDGDYILVARVGANAGLLNRAVGQFGVTDNTLIVNLKEPDKIDFIFYSLDRIGLNKLVFGSGQPLVTGKQLKELNIPFPTNPKEQQKITSCLSAVDELITAQADKIEQLEQHKKGLMQGLFPKIKN